MLCISFKVYFPAVLQHNAVLCVHPREDDDINDVASMAGVNLREENAQILTTVVGSVVQSCQDLPFLSPNPVLSRILHTGTKAACSSLKAFTASVDEIIPPNISAAAQQNSRGASFPRLRR